jgi:hypothetical protein
MRILMIAAFVSLAPTVSTPAQPSKATAATTSRMPTDSEKLETIRQDVAALKARSSKRYTDPDVVLPLLVALLIAAGGWIFAWRVAKQNAQAHSRLRTDDRLFESLKLLAEGSQARGIAIALIEAYWQDMPQFQAPWVSVLTNQAVHLLTRSKERDSSVEIDNILRILDILERVPANSAKPVYRKLLPWYQRSSLREAMQFALHQDEHETGVRLPLDTAGRWYLRLWGVPDEKIPLYLEGDRNILSLNEDIDEHAFD